jgi:hypothetical protein
MIGERSGSQREHNRRPDGSANLCRAAQIRCAIRSRVFENSPVWPPLPRCWRFRGERPKGILIICCSCACPAPPEGRRAPLQVMDVPTGDIETSEVAELSPLTFAVIVSGGTVGINRLEMRKAKYCTFSHSILYPVTPALEIGIYHPHAFGWRDIDHHDRTATLVSDEIAGGRGHICLTNKSMSLKPSIHSSPSVRR